MHDRGPVRLVLFLAALYNDAKRLVRVVRIVRGPVVQNSNFNLLQLSQLLQLESHSELTVGRWFLESLAEDALLLVGC